MIIRPWAAVFLLMLVAAPASAQSGENVAVVINDASPASREIGEYDVAKRAVPEPNVIRIRVTTEDAISRAAFAAGIGQPIAAALRQRGLQDRVPCTSCSPRAYRCGSPAPRDPEARWRASIPN